MTQTELADSMGLSQALIAEYEAGRKNIPVWRLVNLAEYLGVPAETLLQEYEQPRQRRGPPSKFDRLAEQISRLPRSRRRFVVEMIENALGSR